MSETTTCLLEVAAFYERFLWLEKVYPQAKIDCAHVRSFKDIGVEAIRDAFAYTVQTNGDFAEIEQRAVEKPLWPGAVFIDTYKEVDIASAIQQANSAAYIVAVQNRCLTIFGKV